MGQILKIRCNGPNKHINDVDLDDALREVPIAREAEFSSSSAPERIVLRCRECVDGRVIVMRKTIEDARQRNPSR
jgi:hypothetical protein